MIFYVIILKMNNFWNNIMFDKIDTILSDMKNRNYKDQDQIDNLVQHLEIYQKKIDSYPTHKNFVLIALCVMDFFLILS